MKESDKDPDNESLRAVASHAFYKVWSLNIGNYKGHDGAKVIEERWGNGRPGTRNYPALREMIILTSQTLKETT